MNIQQIASISEISTNTWNNLVGEDYPFIRHQFLLALEESEAVCYKTGWQPQHLLVYSNNELIACMPMYLKYHSRGEYVFDYQWAQAYLQQGFEYYPKWLTAIPFTPCQGKRIYTKAGVNLTKIFEIVFDYLKNAADQYSISSWHCLFPEAEQAVLLNTSSLSIRQDVQFHWFNHNFRDFSDYLETFNARNRKKIKRERRRITEQNITFLRIPGKEITETQLSIFFEFYQMTYLKKGMLPYLNKQFFRKIIQTMPQNLLLIMAIKDNSYVAAAFSFVSDVTFYGRYWGCFDEFSCLHFETCYYQGIEYCIDNDLKSFNSGAQGEHKIARGFEPVITYSAHWFKHVQFSQAIENFLKHERPAIENYKEQACNTLPFKGEL